METILQQLQLNEAKLKNLKAEKMLNIKAAGTMLSANVIGSTITHVDAQLLDPIPIKTAYTAVTMDYFPKIMCDSHSIVVVNETADDDDGSFGSVAEGAAKEQVDFDLSATQKSFTKYAAYVKVSEEMIADIHFMSTKIETTLRRRLKNKISTDFLAAIVGATPNVVNTNLTISQGATTNADVFASIYAGMKNLKGYNMNLWLMNDPVYGKTFNEANNNTIWFDMYRPIMDTSTAVASTKIFACDTSMFPIYVYKDINITIGQVNDDFTKNLVTIQAEARVNWNIAGECLNALYNDVIATTITRLA